MTSVTYANGQSVSYTYDSNGNVTGICYDNSSTDRYTYIYDTDGSLTEADDNLAGTKTVYTGTGTEIRKISDNSLLFSSTADDDGAIQQTADSSSVTYSYDSTYNSVTGITTDTVEYTSQATATDDDGNTVDYSVTADTNVNTDWFGRTVSKTATAGVNAVADGNGTTETVSSSTAITYNDTATTATTRVNSYSTTVDNITETEYYEYDGMGNISAVYTLDADGVRTNLNRYFYDEAGQLTREDNHTGSFTAVYAYDIGGNVTSVTKYAYTENSDLSDLTPTETKTFTYRTSGWKDVLTAVNSDAVTTDSLGNVTSIANGQSYEWTAGRQLKKLTEADGSYYLYYYNADGFLSMFDAYDENGVHDASYSYYWDDDKLTAITISEEDNSSCTTQIVYDSEGEAAGFIVNGISAYLYRRNYLGDVTAIYDTEGNEIVHYYYDAFGNPGAVTPEFDSSADALSYIVRATFITALNPILYRGYVWIPVAGYSYYLGSRFYIPSLYRFMNADVYEDTGTGVVGTNMFAYCDNNPVANTDNNGTVSINKIINVFSSICKAIKSIALDVKTIKNKLEKYINKVISVDHSDYSKNTYCVKIDLNADDNFSDEVYYCYKRSKDNLLYYLTYVAMDMFEKFAGRRILFSEDCIKNEIDAHLRGFWWADGKTDVTPPITMYVYGIIEKGTSKDVVKDRCGKIEIDESDVYDLKQRTVFKYKNGIDDYYKGGEYDPFYYSNTSKRKSTPRNDWRMSQ